MHALNVGLKTIAHTKSSRVMVTLRRAIVCVTNVGMNLMDKCLGRTTNDPFSKGNGQVVFKGWF
jgi:hypothetical protein